MFNVQEPVVIQTRSQSRNEQEINTHTERLVQKHNNFLYLKRNYLVLNEEKGKQGNKKEKLTELLHLTLKIAKGSNDNMSYQLQKLRINKNHCRKHKAALDEKPTDSPQ